MKSSVGTHSTTEVSYIKAMSRKRIVNAYAKWRTFSEAEKICFAHFVPRRARILDLGCGTGRALKALGNGFTSYLGVDASETMIGRAKISHPNINFVIGDIVNFTSTPHSYNTVLLLHNVIDMLNPKKRRAKLLHNARTLLESGGVLIASSHLRRRSQKQGYFREQYHGANIYNYRSSLSEWSAEVAESGFNVVLAMQDFRGSTCDWTYIVAKAV